MRQVKLELTLSTVPPVFRRQRHALIVVTDVDHQFILGGKEHYPQGIYRFVGGGLEPDEDAQQGAARELREELQVEATSDDLEPLAEIVATLHVPNEDDIVFTTYLYHYQLPAAEHPEPTDDLDEVVTLSRAELQAVIERFRHLPTDLHPKLGFTWADYGQLYAQIHQLGLDEVTA